MKGLKQKEKAKESAGKCERETTFSSLSCRERRGAFFFKF
jgi:hypothetical protein